MTRKLHFLLVLVASSCFGWADGWKALDATRHEAVVEGWTLTVDSA